ncbi:unnamed protein product, partial [Phaeothamnion confervicola]
MYAGDWVSLGEVQYRKFEVYKLDWDGAREQSELDSHHVAAARFGGPIAMIRDETKLAIRLRATPYISQVAAGGAIGARLRIFSSAGRKLADVPWDDKAAGSSGRLVGIGWTDRELLVTVREQGTVAVFEVLGARVCELNL